MRCALGNPDFWRGLLKLAVAALGLSAVLVYLIWKFLR